MVQLKNYRDIVDSVNKVITWAEKEEMNVVYICHNNVTPSAENFLPGTRGAEFVPELKVVSDNIFVKTKSNALASDGFASFISQNGITEFIVCGADAMDK